MSGNICIADEDIELIMKSERHLSVPNVKTRVEESMISTIVAEKYLQNYNVEVDKNCLCSTDCFTLSYGITDIYINGFYVEVVTKTEDAGYCIPSLNFDKPIAPVAYMFIMAMPEDNTYEVEGFILHNDINTDSIQGSYLVAEKSMLKDFRDIEYLFSGHIEEDLTDDFEKQVFDFFDGQINNTDKFIYTLLNSKIAREFFIKAYRAKSIFRFISTPENEYLNSADNLEFATQVYESDAENAEVSISSAKDEIYELEFDIETPANDNFDINEISESKNYDTNPESEDITDFIQENTVVQESNVPEQTEYIVEDTNTDDGIINEEVSGREKNNDSINTLYENYAEDSVSGINQRKGKSKFIPVLILSLLIASCGYYGYTKFVKQNTTAYNEDMVTEQGEVIDQEKDIEDIQVTEDTPDAMPNETVENTPVNKKTEEAIEVSIPAIEKNLDASVLVENLSVNWQVPMGYVSNSAAKKYFTKLGKIIQLNLKTELLLLNKPPLSNKISLELEFNKNTQSFEIKGITTSSGETSIDDLVKQVVGKVITTTKYSDMNIFNSISGNPVLIINL